MVESVWNSLRVIRHPLWKAMNLCCRRHSLHSANRIFSSGPWPPGGAQNATAGFPSRGMVEQGNLFKPAIYA